MNDFYLICMYALLTGFISNVYLFFLFFSWYLFETIVISKSMYDAWFIQTEMKLVEISQPILNAYAFLVFASHFVTKSKFSPFNNRYLVLVCIRRILKLQMSLPKKYCVNKKNFVQRYY